MGGRWTTAIAVAAFLLVLAGCGIQGAASPSSSQPTNVPAAASAPAPIDLRQLGRFAFIRDGRLILRDGDTEREVAGASPAGALAWSADGCWLAFRQQIGDNSRIVLVDASTGAIGEVPGLPEGPTGYAWAPTGSGLAVSVPGGIWVIPDLADPKPELLAATETPAGDLHWSPDGSRIAWVRTLPFTDPVARDDLLEIVTLKEGQKATWSHLAKDAGISLAGWWPNGKGILFSLRPVHCSSCAADGLPLHSLALDGKEEVELPLTLLQAWLSPDSNRNRLLLVQGGGRTTWDEKSLALCQAASGKCQAFDQPDDAVSLDPALSPDGRQIAFVRATRRPHRGGFASDQELNAWVGSRTLWLMDSDGSDAHEVGAAGGGVYAPAWSGDGHYLLFIKDGALWALELKTERVERIAHVGQPESLFGYYGGVNWWSQRIAWHRTKP